MPSGVSRPLSVRDDRSYRQMSLPASTERRRPSGSSCRSHHRPALTHGRRFLINRRLPRNVRQLRVFLGGTIRWPICRWDVRKETHSWPSSSSGLHISARDPDPGVADMALHRKALALYTRRGLSLCAECHGGSHSRAASGPGLVGSHSIRVAVGSRAGCGWLRRKARPARWTRRSGATAGPVVSSTSGRCCQSRSAHFFVQLRKRTTDDVRA